MKYCSLQVLMQRIPSLGTLSFCLAVLLGGSQATAGWYQEFDELETLEEYYLESLQPILVDIDDNPVQSASRAAKFKELTASQKQQINTRNREGKNRIAEDTRKVQAIIEAGGDLRDPLVDKFFSGYVFPDMTRLDNLADLGNLRGQFVRTYLGTRVSDPNYRNRFIEEVCLPNLKGIYENEEKELHPAARMNAIYLLGLLDSTIGSRAGSVAPVPSPVALDELIRLAEKEDSLLKTGAWASLHRHLQIDAATGGAQIPVPKKNRIKEMARKLLQQSAEENGLEPDVDYWLKRRSIQALGFLRSADSLDLISSVLADKENRFWLRYDALEAIGQLELSRVERNTVLTVAQFLAESLDAESDKINNELADLIFQNMLYQDVDLELAGGIDWDAAAKTTAGQAGTGGGIGGAGRGSGRGGGLGGLGGAGLGAGMGEGEMGAGPGGRGGDPRGGGGGMSGDPRGGGGGMSGDPRGGGAGLGGAGLGGLGGGAGRGGGRGPGLASASGELEKVELPNYLLQVSRRRIKSLAYTGKQVLMPLSESAPSNNGLFSLVESEENRQSIKKIAQLLDQLMKDANVGIVNLDPRRAQPRRRGLDDEVQEDESSVTEKMSQLCKQAAAKIRDAAGIEDPSDEDSTDAQAEVKADSDTQTDPPADPPADPENQND